MEGGGTAGCKRFILRIGTKKECVFMSLKGGTIVKKTNAIKRVGVFFLIMVLIVALTVPVLAAPAPWPARMSTWNWQQQGSRNGYVQCIQRFLMFYNDATSNLIRLNGGVDGAFGSATKDAVQIYQTNKGLQVDGVVGTDTWRTMGYDLVLYGTYNFYHNTAIVMRVDYVPSTGNYDHYTYDTNGNRILSFFRQCTY